MREARKIDARTRFIWLFPHSRRIDRWREGLCCCRSRQAGRPSATHARNATGMEDMPQFIARYVARLLLLQRPFG